MIGVQKRKADCLTQQVALEAAGQQSQQQQQQQQAPKARKRAKVQKSQPSATKTQQQQQAPANTNQNESQDPVWIFGLINNIEQLLFNAQQQQQQRSSSFSSGGSSSRSPPFSMSSMSQASSPSSSCSSTASSNSLCSSLATSSAAAAATSGLKAQSQAAGAAQLQHQLHQIPRSPISRQIKFHEYKGPPSSKRQQQQQQQTFTSNNTNNNNSKSASQVAAKSAAGVATTGSVAHIATTSGAPLGAGQKQCKSKANSAAAATATCGANNRSHKTQQQQQQPTSQVTQNVQLQQQTHLMQQQLTSVGSQMAPPAPIAQQQPPSYLPPTGPPAATTTAYLRLASEQLGGGGGGLSAIDSRPQSSQQLAPPLGSSGRLTAQQWDQQQQQQQQLALNCNTIHNQQPDNHLRVQFQGQPQCEKSVRLSVVPNSLAPAQQTIISVNQQQMGNGSGSISSPARQDNDKFESPLMQHQAAQIQLQPQQLQNQLAYGQDTRGVYMAQTLAGCHSMGEPVNRWPAQANGAANSAGYYVLVNSQQGASNCIGNQYSQPFEQQAADFGPGEFMAHEYQGATSYVTAQQQQQQQQQADESVQMAQQHQSAPSVTELGYESEQTSLDGIDELLFSEYIDLQDVPLNVDESDWLKKFLPPCSM